MLTLQENQLHYPLKERIGLAALYVQKKAVFSDFTAWIDMIPKELSKSRGLFGRRNSGKTAFVQRLYNRLWTHNGGTVPFYLEIPEMRLWLPNFAEDYYRNFVSQYISFLDRDPSRVSQVMSLDQIREYGERHGYRAMVEDVDHFKAFFPSRRFDQMWRLAISAPHRFSALYGRPVLVMLDEFQNLGRFVYADECKLHNDPSIVDGFHEWCESKSAPMLVTASLRGRQGRVMDSFLEAGCLTKYPWLPCLGEQEGVEAVYRYAQAYEVALTNETALLINGLTRSDPYFIACMFRCVGAADKDLSSPAAVLRWATHQLTHRDAELATGWMVHLDRILGEENHIQIKRLLLFFTQNPGRTFAAEDLREELDLESEPEQIFDMLIHLQHTGLILSTPREFAFEGHADPTLSLVLQERFRDVLDAEGQARDWLVARMDEFVAGREGMGDCLEDLAPSFAALQLAYDMCERERFPLSAYFDGMDHERPIAVARVCWRYLAQKRIGDKRQYDLMVASHDERVLLVEVRRNGKPIGIDQVKHFLARVRFFREAEGKAETLAAILSIAGFEPDALALCRENGVGTASRLNYLRADWSR